jgi:hypothetical protein
MNTWRVDNGAARPLAKGGSACAMVSVHIAINGQSWQSLLFCFSEQQFMPSAKTVGQQGISPDIAGISMAAAAASRFAAPGVANGAATSPAIAMTASKRPMSRHKFIVYHYIRWRTWEGGLLHMSANEVSKTF